MKYLFPILLIANAYGSSLMDSSLMGGTLMDSSLMDSRVVSNPRPAQPPIKQEAPKEKK